ncbi:MAG TPA: cache domain-containing protein [Methanospirillum sp.]|nr:cache domain-containing protein [Methanospirillum sp.]
MRSIFWIGCILAILVSLLVSGAAAGSMENSTVEAAKAEVAPVTAVVEMAENVTATVAEAVNGTEKTEAKNVTAEKADVNLTNVSPVVKPAEVDMVNETLVKFVTGAKSFAAMNGKEVALAAFNDPRGAYVNKDMYIFAYDYTGKVLANPLNLDQVGTNQISLTDSKGYRFVQMMVDTAKKGSGFVKYQDVNLMKMSSVMDKVSYVADVDGTWFVGAGVFKDKDAPVAPKVVPKVEEKAGSDKPAEATSAINATPAEVIPATPVVKAEVNATEANATVVKA